MVFPFKMAVTQAYSQNLQRLFTGEGMPDMSPDSFVLMVDRGNIVDSTVVQLIRSDEENFKKPLKVWSFSKFLSRFSLIERRVKAILGRRVCYNFFEISF